LHRKCRGVFDRLDEVNLAPERSIETPERPFDLGVSVMTDQNDLTGLARVTANLHVHFGHERTGGIENGEAASVRLILDSLGNPMSRENDCGAIGNFVELFDEYRAHRAQTLDDMFVMDDFVSNVNWCPEKSDGTLDDIDRPIDAGTKAARIGEHDVHRLRLQSAKAS